MTKPRAYYNEIDDYAAQWLRNLIEARLIADGDVDRRDIRDVTPAELSSYTQCHFFAGIGVWSYALRLAGWPDDLPVWTGSCPCQPFSAAGKRGGLDDERHLWPAWDWLIGQCAPQSIFGEQVASSDGLGWLDLVCSDLEGKNYAVGSPDSCAAGVGAPHIRQRLRFVAYADGGNASPAWEQRGGEQRQFAQDGATGDMAYAECQRRERGRSGEAGDGRRWPFAPTDGLRASSALADAAGARSIGPVAASEGNSRDEARLFMPGAVKSVGGMANTDESQWRRRASDGRGECDRPDAGWAENNSLASGLGEIRELEHAARDGRDERRPEPGGGGIVGGRGDVLPRPTNGFWRNADWIACTDGKWRPIEPGTFPLVDGSAFRLGSGSAFEGRSRAKMLKGYGNAVVAPDMAAFIAAAMEWRP